MTRLGLAGFLRNGKAPCMREKEFIAQTPSTCKLQLFERQLIKGKRPRELMTGGGEDVHISDIGHTSQ